DKTVARIEERISAWIFVPKGSPHFTLVMLLRVLQLLYFIWSTFLRAQHIGPEEAKQHTTTLVINPD
ncbi:hypothetical protein RJ639_001638, partial [Escallonia herrerae]